MSPRGRWPSRTTSRNHSAQMIEIRSLERSVSLLFPIHSIRYIICAQILGKGEVQVGDKEREHDIAALRREIATLVAEKCVDPATRAPYSVSIIEKAMTEAGYSVRANKNAKSQVRPVIVPCHSNRTNFCHQGVRVHQDAPIGFHASHRAC